MLALKVELWGYATQEVYGFLSREFGPESGGRRGLRCSGGLREIILQLLEEPSSSQAARGTQEMQENSSFHKEIWGAAVQTIEG